MDSLFKGQTPSRLLEQYSSLQRIAKIGVWELRISDLRLLWSDETHRIFGTQRESFVPTHDSLLSKIHPEDVTSFKKALECASAGRTPLDITHRIVFVNGSIRHVHQRAQNYIDDEGDTVLMGTVHDVTDQVSDSHKLQKTESLLQFATEMIRIGAWEVEIGATHVTWSDEVCDIHEVTNGFKPTIEEGLHFYTPDSRQKVKQAFECCITQGLSFDEVLQIVTAKGRLRWVRAMGRAVFSENGKIQKVGGAFQDITEQKKIEEEAIHTARRLTNTLESITDAFFVLNENWQFTYLNGQGERLLKRSRSELLGKNVWHEFPEAVGTSFYIEYHRALKAQCTVSFKEFYPPLDCWFDVRVFPTEEGLAVYFHDVTEQHKSQYTLQISEDRFNLVAKATSDAIWDWDLATDAVWWNNNMQTLFGFAPDELETDSTSWTSRVHPKDKDRITVSIHSAISSGKETWSGEYRFLCKDGSYAYVLDRGYIMRDASGQAIRMVGCMSDFTEKRKSELEIHRLAYYDTLTGLPNRRFLLERLKARLSIGASRGRNGALLFMDLDNFKGLNDTYGHDQGDELLNQVASRLTSCMRSSDIVARLGGDEFVVLVENLDENLAEAMNQSELVAQKIQNAFKPPFRIASSDLYTTPSIGIALFDTNKTAFEMLKRADLAMYKAKADGRNAICLYSPEIELSMSAKMQLETDIRVGLLNNQFMLHFQPQVDIEGRVIGAEALARWLHPVRGFVPPKEFISNAEESGLIIELGEWILREGCRQLVQWARHPELKNLTLAINVSAKQFQHPEFVKTVIDVLNQTGADPSKLELELTESMLVDDAEAVIKRMMTLKKQGIHFSLDDFGTGYSSLIYLKRLPIEKLKIDQSFIRDIFTDENSEAIAKTIIALAKNLELTVLAEGVEKPEQQDWLAQHGCEVYQGYLFSRPINEVEFIAYAIDNVHPCKH